MNERLKQLAIESKLIAPEYNGFDHTRLSISQQRFAELIVRECYEHCKGQVLDKEVADTNELTYNDAVSDCANGLLQHFGVEE
jgi:hypothetical protein